VEAAGRFKEGKAPAEKVRVYEKIKQGIWVYNGVFDLVDAWDESDGKRKVFKFRLEVAPDQAQTEQDKADGLKHTRVIPTSVKREVWKRDSGQCIICGSQENLHFDHDIPFSKGGSSLVAENIRLLCAKHNLAKRDRIE
jgi:hypothetical protein